MIRLLLVIQMVTLAKFFVRYFLGWTNFPYCGLNFLMAFISWKLRFSIDTFLALSQFLDSYACHDVLKFQLRYNGDETIIIIHLLQVSITNNSLSTYISKSVEFPRYRKIYSKPYGETNGRNLRPNCLPVCFKYISYMPTWKTPLLEFLRAKVLYDLFDQGIFFGLFSVRWSYEGWRK